MPTTKKPFVGPPKSLSNESQAQLAISEKRLAELRGGKPGVQAAKPPPKKPLPPNIFGAAQALRDLAKR